MPRFSNFGGRGRVSEHEIETPADPLTLTGTDAADSLTGDTGDDTIDGGIGDDVLYGTRGSDVLIGGEGTDTADYSDSRSIALTLDGTVRQGRSSEDTLDSVEVVIGAENGRNVIDGSNDDAETDLSISVDLAKEALTILDGSDGSEVSYTITNFDHVRGTSNDDIIIGNDENNRLSGGEGDDYLAGGLGRNMLSGGDGADSFVLAGGTDVIRDFDADEGDKIDIASAIAEITDSKGGALVTFEDESSVRLIGYDADQVSTDWFALSLL